MNECHTRRRIFDGASLSKFVESPVIGFGSLCTTCLHHCAVQSLTDDSLIGLSRVTVLYHVSDALSALDASPENQGSGPQHFDCFRGPSLWDVGDHAAESNTYKYRSAGTNPLVGPGRQPRHSPLKAGRELLIRDTSFSEEIQLWDGRFSASALRGINVTANSGINDPQTRCRRELLCRAFSLEI